MQSYYWLMIICYTVAGFGQGGVFLGTLGICLKTLTSYPGACACCLSPALPL